LSPRSFSRTIHRVGPSLRSLSLEMWDDDTAKATANCVCLEELQLWSNFFLTSTTLIETLPTTLQHFAFYLHGLLDSERVAKEAATIPLVTTRMPSLRAVTSYNYLGECERRWAAPFLRHCRGEGIEVRQRVTGGGESAVDFITPCKFPRDRSVANFALMAPSVEIKRPASFFEVPLQSPSSHRKVFQRLKPFNAFGRILKASLDRAHHSDYAQLD